MGRVAIATERLRRRRFAVRPWQLPAETSPILHSTQNDDWRACGLHGWKTVPAPTAGMDGYLLAVMEDRHHAFAGTNPHFLPDQRMGNAVVVTLENNVVVDVHFGIFPTRKLIGIFRSGKQGMPIQFFEQLTARFSQVLHFLLIEMPAAARSHDWLPPD